MHILTSLFQGPIMEWPGEMLGYEVPVFLLISVFVTVIYFVSKKKRMYKSVIVDNELKEFSTDVVFNQRDILMQAKETNYDHDRLPFTNFSLKKFYSRCGYALLIVVLIVFIALRN